jgi:hypothetical protein
VIYQEGSRRPRKKNKLTVIYYILYLSNIRKLNEMGVADSLLGM